MGHIFSSRKDAAERLAQRLLKSIYHKNYAGNLVVVAIPKGGIIIGDIVAQRLGCRLDIITSRFIGSDFFPELEENQLIKLRGSKEYDDVLSGKNIILVDDGIATGSTIIANAKWIKANQKYKNLIVAVPVAPYKTDAIDKLRNIADELVTICSPMDFSTIYQFYQQYEQVTYEEVEMIMKKWL